MGGGVTKFGHFCKFGLFLIDMIPNLVGDIMEVVWNITSQSFIANQIAHNNNK